MAADAADTAISGTEKAMRVISIHSMRELERLSGVPGPELMLRAGTGAAELIRKEFFRYPERRRIVIATGRGNNAGDGIVAALSLAEDASLPPPVIAAAFPVEQLTGEAGVYAPKLAGSRVTVTDKPDFRDGDLIVDALFGIGLSRPIEEPYLAWVRAVNDSRCPVVALDLPSGLNGNTGELYGECIRASLTITFGLPKTGLFRNKGPAVCGRLASVMLDIPDEILTQLPAEMTAFYRQDAAELLPPLAFDVYKNTRGRLLIAAGSVQYPGAAQLVTAAALRTGAGFVRLATGAPGPFPPPVVLHPDTPEALQKILPVNDAVTAGPGWGADAAHAKLLQFLLAAGKPLVLDADALNLLAKYENVKLPENTILTPHAGEAARLLPGLPEERTNAARALTEKYQCITVLKGPQTVVAAPDGRISINTSGSPALGIAGSGDVLSGVIGALLAQGLPAWDAARLGVWLHGAAGESVPMRGLRADDLPDKVREVMGKIAPLC